MATFRATTSHIGLCVRDLERSRRFYVDGLGFREFVRFELDRPIAELDPPCSLTSFFVEKDGLRSGQDDPAAVQIIFLEDPDGTRVALMRLAEGQQW